MLDYVGFGWIWSYVWPASLAQQLCTTSLTWSCLKHVKATTETSHRKTRAPSPIQTTKENVKETDHSISDHSETNCLPRYMINPLTSSHSAQGPARPSDTWANAPRAPETSFRVRSPSCISRNKPHHEAKTRWRV